MTVNQVRRAMYRGASFLGDVQAVRKGPRAVGKRYVRKTGWRLFTKLIQTVLR